MSRSVARRSIAFEMLRRATEALLDAGAAAPGAVRRMDDRALTVALRECEASAETARRLDNRDLFKRAVWAELADVPDDIVDADHEAVREFERDIAAHADVDPMNVVLDVPARPDVRESTSSVVVNGEVRALGSQSTLVKALRRASREQWRLGVYAPERLTDAVGAAAESVLGLELDALVVDVRQGINATLDEF